MRDLHPVADGGRPRADPMTSDAGRGRRRPSRRRAAGIELHEAGVAAPAAAQARSSAAPAAPEGGEAETPHYHGHRERLRRASGRPAPGAVADYELLELVLFRAIPRRDVKPLAKALVARFGSFAEAIAARAGTAGRSRGHERGRDRRIQDRRSRRAALRQGRGQEAAADGLVERSDRLLPHGDGLRARNLPHPVSRPRTA